MTPTSIPMRARAVTEVVVKKCGSKSVRHTESANEATHRQAISKVSKRVLIIKPHRGKGGLHHREGAKRAKRSIRISRRVAETSYGKKSSARISRSNCSPHTIHNRSLQSRPSPPPAHLLWPHFTTKPMGIHNSRNSISRVSRCSRTIIHKHQNKATGNNNKAGSLKRLGGKGRRQAKGSRMFLLELH